MDWHMFLSQNYINSHHKTIFFWKTKHKHPDLWPNNFCTVSIFAFSVSYFCLSLSVWNDLTPYSVHFTISSPSVSFTLCELQTPAKKKTASPNTNCLANYLINVTHCGPCSFFMWHEWVPWLATFNLFVMPSGPNKRKQTPSVWE